MEDQRPSTPLPRRSTLAHGIVQPAGTPIIVFLTVCTKDRRKWLATQEVHTRLIGIWQDAAAWLVGRYVIMPDHIHLFAAPGQQDFPLDNWVRYWKSRFSKLHGNPEDRWQAGFWDTRLRRAESYNTKWEYVRGNPVRHGLARFADEWPFQGDLNELPW